MSEFLIDPILPKCEVHLLAGPSGAGKTRWLLNLLLDWEKGKPVFGYATNPVPWVYVGADRGMESVTRTLVGMGIDPKRISTIPAWDKGLNFNQIMDAVDKSGAKLAVIESFGSFVEPPANSACVKSFLHRASKWCRQAELTIIGVVESPKMKPYERYENPRQRVSGAAAWAHFTETIFLVEPTDVKDPKLPTRQLYVCPRNVAGATYTAAFDEMGRLIF